MGTDHADLLVKIVDVKWFRSQPEKQFKHLYKYLLECKDESIYEDELIKLLLFFQNDLYTSQIFYRVFLPYFFYMLCTLYYFTYVVTDIDRD